MSIEVSENRTGGALVLSPVGRLDSANAHSFERTVMGHVGGGERRIVIDFGQLNFISSSGLRILLIVAKALRTDGGKLVLCSMKDHIREVFDISGFGQIIPIEDSLEGALGAV